MIKLDQKILNLKLNPIIIFKLQKLHFTKIGHLVMSSYPELLYTHIFTYQELEDIQNSLINIGLNYVSEIKLENIPHLKKELMKFNFDEYQKNLYTAHHKKYDENQIEQLKYSDSISLVKYLYFLYGQLYSKEFHVDTKMVLDNFLKSHPYMTIADFVYIHTNSIDEKVIELISNILGLPINSKLPYNETFTRENQIFNKENVQTENLKTYEQTFSKKQNIEEFINQNKPKVLKKS